MRKAVAILVVIPALLIAGCGEEAATEVGVRGGPVPEHLRLLEANKGKVAKVEKITFTENENWNEIKALFLGALAPDKKDKKEPEPFVRNRLEDVRDPFEPQLVRFVPKIELVSEAPGGGIVDGGGAIDPTDDDILDNPPQVTELGPTQRFRVQDYRAVLIKWGTSVNKALVQDPDGNTYVVSKDMKLGNNNGRVTEITRYEVWVQEDNSDKPLNISIEPEIIRVKSAGAEEDDTRLFPESSKNL